MSKDETIRLMAPGHSTGYAEPEASWVGEPIGDLLRHYGINFGGHAVKINNKTVKDSSTRVPAGAVITVSKAVTNG